MNKGVSIIIIVALLLLIGVTEQVLFHNYIESSKQDASQIEMLIKTQFGIDPQGLNEQIEAFEKRWKKRENVLSTFSINKELEDIGTLLVKLKAAVQFNHERESNEQINLILFYLQEYKNINATRFQNIF